MADGAKSLTLVKILFWLVATGGLLAFLIGKWDQVNEVGAGDFSLRIRAELNQPGPTTSAQPAPAPAPTPTSESPAPRPAPGNSELAHYQQLLKNLYDLGQSQQLQTQAAERLGQQLMAAYQTQLWQELQGQQQEQQMLKTLLPYLERFSQQ